MKDIPRAVDPFLNDDFLGPEGVLNLVQLPVMGYGKVVAERPLGLDGKNVVKLPAAGGWPVKIAFLCRSAPELPVVLREIPG